MNKLKTQQLFLDLKEKWGHKTATPKLERQTGEYVVKTYQRKKPWAETSTETSATVGKSEL